MVRYARRRLDDEDWDDYDPRYFPKKVFKDGRGPSVRLYMTDARPRPRQPVLDARVAQPGPVADKLALMGGRSALSDARVRCDDAYERYCNRLGDQWTWNKPGVLAPVPVGDARGDYIRRTTEAWRTPTVRRDLRRTDTTANGGRFVAGPISGGPDSSYKPNSTTLSQQRTPRPDDDDDDDGNGDYDYTATDPEGGDDDYTRGVWAAQNAIRPGSRDVVAQVEAARRRVTHEDAQSIRDRAYAEMVTRLGDAWKNP
jgi:hypothetical protein